jgi:hypothetical protein
MSKAIAKKSNGSGNEPKEEAKKHENVNEKRSFKFGKTHPKSSEILH